MYVHKNCALSGAVLDMDSRTSGFCDVCDQEGTIYHVEGTEDYYEKIVAGVRWRVVDGKEYNTRAAVRARYRELDYLAKATRLMDEHNERVASWMMDHDPKNFEANWTAREEAESIPFKVKATVSEDAKIDFEKEELTVTVELEAETVEEEDFTPEEEASIDRAIESAQKGPLVKPEKELDPSDLEQMEEEEVPLESSGDPPISDVPVETPTVEPEVEEEPEKALEDLTKEELLEMLREAEKDD